MTQPCLALAATVFTRMLLLLHLVECCCIYLNVVATTDWNVTATTLARILLIADWNVDAIALVVMMLSYATATLLVKFCYCNTFRQILLLRLYLSI